MAAQTTNTKPTGPVTLQMIADACGVSVITVSRSLRNDPRVKSATHARIVEMAATMGYDPALTHAARRMRLTRSGQTVVNQMLGLILPPGQFFHHQYYHLVLDGILDTLATSGFTLVTHYLPPAAVSAVPPGLPAIFARGDIDGVILLAKPDDRQTIITYLRGLPLFDQRPICTLMDASPSSSTIMVDDWRGGYLAADHLLTLGHRHLLHFYESDGEHQYRERLAGTRQAYDDHGENPDEHLLRVDKYWYVEDDAYVCDFLRDALGRRPSLTGIIARNDYEAWKIAKALHALGRRVPEDVSLVGFDDTTPIHDDAWHNILTTVRVPLHDVGAAAAALLLAQIAQGNHETTRVHLPVSFVPRSSTAPPRDQEERA